MQEELADVVLGRRLEAADEAHGLVAVDVHALGVHVLYRRACVLRILSARVDVLVYWVVRLQQPCVDARVGRSWMRGMRFSFRWFVGLQHPCRRLEWSYVNVVSSSWDCRISLPIFVFEVLGQVAVSARFMRSQSCLAFICLTDLADDACSAYFIVLDSGLGASVALNVATLLAAVSEAVTA